MSGGYVSGGYVSRDSGSVTPRRNDRRQERTEGGRSPPTPETPVRDYPQMIAETDRVEPAP